VREARRRGAPGRMADLSTGFFLDGMIFFIKDLGNGDALPGDGSMPLDVQFVKFLL
jgi:hypothetical protein